jgi:HSP90 family molecular chaperone
VLSWNRSQSQIDCIIFPSMSLKNIHKALLESSSGETQVSVNQRHLIDKILARYSTEFTIFRELLQNSNDAGASSATIIFRTNKKNRVETIEYKNNGRPFLPEDWARLRKIAEGNPDEQKIGFFGVGFYSLFSIAEEPFISSGNQCMAFFWKGDQLYTKVGEMPKYEELTTFLLEMREPEELPVIKVRPHSQQ